MGKAYNPDDYLCRICVYKSCLYKNKGREILSKAAKKIKDKKRTKTLMISASEDI